MLVPSFNGGRSRNHLKLINVFVPRSIWVAGLSLIDLSNCVQNIQRLVQVELGIVIVLLDWVYS